MQELSHVASGSHFPILSLLVTAFIAVLYIQSGADKVMDMDGNLGWLRQHFGKSIFKNMVPPMFYTVVLLEVGSAILCLAGIGQMLIKGDTHLALYGALASAVNLICLFTGQRFAKDYAGAASLVPYFLLSIVAMVICYFEPALLRLL